MVGSKTMNAPEDAEDAIINISQDFRVVDSGRD